MKKLFDLVVYVIMLPLTMVIVLFKTSESERGISYNADQAISDSSAMMSGVRNIYSKIDTETNKIVEAR